MVDIKELWHTVHFIYNRVSIIEGWYKNQWWQAEHLSSYLTSLEMTCSKYSVPRITTMSPKKIVERLRILLSSSCIPVDQVCCKTSQAYYHALYNTKNNSNTQLSQLIRLMLQFMLRNSSEKVLVSLERF